jgi:signal transduction histidine kinase
MSEHGLSFIGAAVDSSAPAAWRQAACLHCRPMVDRELVKASWSDWWGFSLDPRGPRWLQWLWTAFFCLLVAVGITVLLVALRGRIDAAKLAPLFVDNLIVSLTIGLLIQGLFDIGVALVGMRRLRRLSTGWIVVYWSAIAVAGVTIGWPLGMAVTGRDVFELAQHNPNALRGSIGISALLTLCILVWIANVSRRTDAERRAAEAQLRLIQGQMEPHFLFNTLANVLSLMDTDTPRARQMLEAFIDYLRASLGQMRHERHTVADELGLVRTYLQLLQMRMDDRLRFDIEADADAERALLPPLLLQPLVENAIHHGLEPKVEGGHLRVQAQVADGRLVLRVCDDGLGLNAPPRPRGAGAGMALANVRQRLLARYGAGAGLTLEALAAGTCATIELPHEDKDTCPPH